MFQKVISTPGFWRSAFSLGIAFASIFVIIKWAIEGFNMEYFNSIINPFSFVISLLVGGFTYGFFVTFGKFRAKLKKEEQKF
ncbi:MAG: hypothetical protein P8J69_01255 [Flavobacteriaceae bacterium]|nr:hypothetical protein [Flavobacteriaceae bacterium]